MALFEGIIPAVTTPFDGSGAIDEAALERNVVAYLDAGVHGVVANGTMGEAGSLSAAERRTVVRVIARAAAGRVPVIAGVSAGTPSAAIGFAADAAEEGATALMMLPPLGYHGDATEVTAFYRAVAEAGGLPLMAYNNPAASGVDMAPELIAGLGREIENLVAVKECSGDVRRIPAIIALAPELEVLVGGDDWALEGFCAGATGWVTGVAGVRPGGGGWGRRAGRVRRALGALPRRRARPRPRDLPADAAGRALRHDAEARAVLQGRDGPGPPGRRAG